MSIDGISIYYCISRRLRGSVKGRKAYKRKVYQREVCDAGEGIFPWRLLYNKLQNNTEYAL